MKKEKRLLMNFVIWDDNQERLLKAKKLGLAKGNVINEMLREYYDKYIEQQANRLKQSVNAH